MDNKTKSFLLTFFGVLLIMCPFTCLFGLYFFEKGLDLMEV